jgi:demethylmenaquinone methyltransferase / 2-methoxy-6-polyprenyl-1,4-benzoquinol methylase
MSGNMSGNGPSDEVDFGYRAVPRTEKAGLVRDVFDSVAPRYDLMNDLMSLGIHRVWKREFVRMLDPRPNRRLLDLAGGTGDIVRLWRGMGGGEAILSDVNQSMLEAGRARAPAGVALVAADAERLPIADRSVERVSIAFGLRNCTDKLAVLREARRVLRPGGRFLCLEFSRFQIGALAPLYEAWSFQVLPRLGAAVAGDRESYQYLAESIRTFPDQQELAAMFREAGFSRVTFSNLSGGIAAVHAGWRL